VPRVHVEGTSRLVSLFEAEDRYIIPTYQRGYSWETEHVTELLEDLEVVHDNNDEKQHFFGTILVTDHDPTNVMKIIDGQQRLTTVVLLLICARNFFRSKKEFGTAKEYSKRLEEYISRGKQKMPVLVLSRTNKELFDKIRRSDDVEKTWLETHSKSNDSNELLTNAYKTIQSWVAEKDKGDSGEAIETVYGLVKTLFNKFVIYKYHYKKESNAYAVFNLVNNRGTGLNESDLIKNYLFGELARRGTDEKELDEYDIIWDKIRHFVTSKTKAAYQLDRFFYHYLSAFYSDKLSGKKRDKDAVCLKQKNVHESFMELIGIKPAGRSINVSKAISPKSLIEDMAKWSEILEQLRNPTKNIFPRNNILHYLEKIKDVKAVFVYPAILAGYREYWDQNSRKQFEALVMMCFRYHVRVKVIGTSMSVSTYQEIMCNITNKINSGISVETIINELMKKEEEYPSDDRVYQNLLELRVSSAKLAKALLEEAEYGNSDERSLADASIEHIMPRNITEWKGDIKPGELSVEEFHDKYFSLLGNQTLLSRQKNTKFSNKRYIDKVKEYAKEEKYRITREIATEPVWDENAIIRRQERLATSILKTINLSQITDECKL